MMWSFFSKDGSKDSLYEIEKKVTSFDNESLFVLFKGKIKVSHLMTIARMGIAR